MSGKIMGKVWDLDLPHNQLLVLLSLADHADHEGKNVFPSLGLTSWKTGYSEQQVRRVLRDLEKAKILLVVERKAGKRTVYQIDLSAGKLKPEYVYTPSKMSGVSKSKGYQNDSGDPLHFDTSTPDILPEETTGINRHREPSLEPSNTDVVVLTIKAWIDGQIVPPITNQYGNKGVRSNAKAIAQAGYTPEQVTTFVKEISVMPYWSGKLVPIGYVANNIAARFAIKPAAINPSHVPFAPVEIVPDAVPMPDEARAALQSLAKSVHVNDEVIHAELAKSA